VSGFYDALDDLIAQTGDEEYQFHNVDEARSAGAEVELAWARSRGGRVRASYTFQRAEDGATGERLPNSPEHLARLNLSVPLVGDRLATGLEVRYTSTTRTLPDRAVSEAGASCLVDWTLLSARLVKGLELSAGAYNLFDTRYAFPGGTGHVQDVIPQDGRSFLVRAAYRY
jgi:iron complex outermembrane receptor protein